MTQNVSGNVFGGVFQARFAYVQEKHGKDGLERLIETMKRNGYTGPTTPSEFKLADKYPVEYMLAFVEGYLKEFGNEAFDRMSRTVAKRKGIVGFLVRWAGSPELLVNKAAEYWPNFYDFGRLEGKVEGKGMGILTGHDLSPTPLFCRTLTGYFLGVMDNARPSGVVVEHTKCVHKGDEHCEWKITWEK